MGLSNAVEDARHTSQVITWTDAEGDAQNLTGATLTGRIRDRKTGIERAVDGTLVVTDAANGVFTWTYGAADVADDGVFDVQFIATYAGQNDKTLIERWIVFEAI